MRLSVRVLLSFCFAAFLIRFVCLRLLPSHKRKPPEFPASSPTRKDR